MSGNGFSVRVATADEVGAIVEWAASEGWNPGLSDAALFRAQDPEGFFVGVEDGVPVSAVSVVNYGDALSFLGLYIVREGWRGKGFGMATWRAGLAHAGTRPVGLDGVVAQQDNYRRSGFALAHRNVRYAGTVAAPTASEAPGIVAFGEVAFESVLAYDAACFPADRATFLHGWVSAPSHHARALLRDGRLAGFGVIRLCREGHKVGPLFADDRAGAEALFDALLAAAGGGLVFLDVPEPNGGAVSLAESRGLAPAFETARMYTGPVRPVAADRVFGITTFELG
ncbi:GNAT family N-acetyltransferase [Azospirillum sp. SYSU D00513]|uniref:GNAT family N-acetyltransferase n=1 Tax=Azospirillum sp. SYSU D00513 TaxID=2812561 RepID=UPI001A95F679|nr:GNAT family N-acetyltransferase [Azospirillum sp. SYSU D00513]